MTRDHCECCVDAATSADIRELTSAVRALISEIRGRRTPAAPGFGQEPEIRTLHSERVQRAAARVRVKVDKQAGTTTPEWIRRLAEEPE